MSSSGFCVLPWRHLATHPYGGVSLCCRVEFVESSGMAYNDASDEGAPRHLNLNHDSVESIVNSDSFRRDRLDMLSGGKPKACRGCYEDEERGLESKRQRENKIFSPFDANRAREITASDGRIEPALDFIELRLGNLCNLKCRTCNPASSTKWSGEYERLREKVPFIESYPDHFEFGWTEDPRFWNELLEASSPLKMIYINGGEPTLIKAHWKFLEDLIVSGRAGGIELRYNSNMTYLAPKSFEIWKKFRRVSVGASIDDIGARARYIRFPSDWKTVSQNMLTLRDAGVFVDIIQTVSAMNFYHLDALWDWARREGIQLGYNFVYNPDFLSPQALPLTLRNEILKDLRSSLPEFLWNPLVLATQGPDRPDLTEKFVRYTKALDEERGEDFAAAFPEVAGRLNWSSVPC